MRVVAALGGNALLRRGQPLTAENQRANARIACKALAPIALEHDLIVSHGNGPQVGLLALQGSAYTEVDPYPLDLLGAQTEGMIGYVIQQELGNELPFEKRLASLLTLIEVDPDDPAFADPTKPIGPIYSGGRRGCGLTREKGWVFKPDGASFRRVVPSSAAAADLRDRAASSGCSPMTASSFAPAGAAVPVMYTDVPAAAGRQLVGVEAVIDEDLASALLAKDVHADALVIVTDVDAVYTDWGTPHQRAIRRASPSALAGSEFAAGSMGPKVRAACSFVEQTGGLAVIGAMSDTPGLLRGDVGTTVTLEASDVELAAPR